MTITFSTWRFGMPPGETAARSHIQRDAVWPKTIECQLYQGQRGRIFHIQDAYLEGSEMIHEAAKPAGE